MASKLPHAMLLGLRPASKLRNVGCAAWHRRSLSPTGWPSFGTLRQWPARSLRSPSQCPCCTEASPEPSEGSQHERWDVDKRKSWKRRLGGPHLRLCMIFNVSTSSLHKIDLQSVRDGGPGAPPMQSIDSGEVAQEDSWFCVAAAVELQVLFVLGAAVAFVAWWKARGFPAGRKQPQSVSRFLSRGRDGGVHYFVGMHRVGAGE